MNKDKQQEDYLKKFINEDDAREPREIQKIQHDNNSLDFLNVDLDNLPLGMFYKSGFQIKIRSAKVYEVQSYSVVDNVNFLDVTEKMNQLLSSCVKVILPNGKNGSYKDVKDGDRLFLIFMIRELTFQSGNSLAKEVQCEYCSHEFSIPFRATQNSKSPKTFVSHEMPKTLKKYFDKNNKYFVFNINGADYKLSPPTIGIQEIFYQNIKDKVQNKKTPNVSFLKIIPFLLHDRITITDDGIKAKEDEFKKYDMTTFQILNHAVDKMLFGLKEMKMKCPECSQEVYTDITFPDGASSLFTISNPFDLLT